MIVSGLYNHLIDLVGWCGFFRASRQKDVHEGDFFSPNFGHHLEDVARLYILIYTIDRLYRLCTVIDTYRIGYIV